jgi:hypothetical protein
MATSTVTPDPETMDLNDLRLLAEKEAREATTTQPEKKVAVTQTVEEEEDGEETEETEKPESTTTIPKTFVAERSFDLGDGAGSQVFKGKGGTREDALEDLADKLAEAQRNATKRIKELKQPKTETGPTKEETESLRAAKVVTNPTEVVKEVLGIDPSELQDVVAEVKQNRAIRQRKAVADEFVVKHPEFLDNARNGQRLAKAIALFGEFTLENFEKAYQDLSESGLLEVKGEEASAEQKKADAEAQRIADAAEAASSQRTRKASGISTHRATSVPRTAEPTEDDMYKMPLDELRAAAEKQLRG